MTSANVTEFLIFREGVQVGKIYQHHLCKDRSMEALKFIPMHEHTIQATWFDEEEEYHENPPVNLFDWVSKHRWFQMAGKISQPRAK